MRGYGKGKRGEEEQSNGGVGGVETFSVLGGEKLALETIQSPPVWHGGVGKVREEVRCLHVRGEGQSYGSGQDPAAQTGSSGEW